MDGFLIAIHLRAKGTPCKRVFRVSRNLDRFSIHDFYQKPTGVRSIIRANRPFYFSQHSNLLRYENAAECPALWAGSFTPNIFYLHDNNNPIITPLLVNIICTRRWGI
jgi:hypothetical protein